MERDREGVKERGEGGMEGGQSHALCEKGVVRSCRGGGQRKGGWRGSHRAQ